MKHVLITGGSDGLGKITGQKLNEAGFTVTLLGRDEEKTKAAAEELGCSYVVADVSEYQQVKAAVEEAQKTNGSIDILVNNAGIWIQDALETNDPNSIKRVMEVNATGAIYCTQAVIPAMKERKSGRIINISSQGGLHAKAERSVYTASKWALTGFTKAMQMELKPFNIAVDGFYPGAMQHRMQQADIFAKAGNRRDMSKALDGNIVADVIVYVCKLPDGVRITEFGIEGLSY